MYKVQTIINRCKTTSAISWVIAWVQDALSREFLEVGDCSVRRLNKELCALAMLKLSFHEYFLTDFVDKHPFSVRAKTTIRTVLATHATVREKLTSYPGDPPVEISWQSTQQASTVQLIELIEGIVYGDQYDSLLRTGQQP